MGTLRSQSLTKATRGIGAVLHLPPMVRAALVGLGGLVMVMFSVPMFAGARRAAAWPTTTGTLDGCSVQERTGGRRGKGSSRTYEVSAQYHFKVNGTDYKGYRRCFGNDRYWLRSSALKVWGEYRLGESRTVYYDPADPNQSCLEPSAGSAAWWLLGTGLAVLTIGVLCAVPAGTFVRGRTPPTPSL